MMSHGYGRQSDEPDASAPLDAWSFAQRLLGKPFPSLVSRSKTGRPSDELLAWLATISPKHADQVRAESAEQARAGAEREQLEWLAKISTKHEQQLRQLQIAEARASEPPNPWLRFRTDASLQEAGWDPAKHPRRGGAPNAGWFAGTGGGGASAGAGRSSTYGTHGESGDEVDQSKPPTRALALAGQWHVAKGKLEQYRRDMATLPERIERERAQLGTGGRYAYDHAQNLAKAEQDLATAKAEAPRIEKEMKELERDYKESGYDEVEFAVWTPGETLVGGKGIENVGRAINMGGSPAGLKPTNVEIDIAIAARAAAAALRAGKALLTGSALPKGFDPKKGFASFDDFKEAFGSAGPDQAWHHVVEQTINSGKFAPEILHNPANLLKLPHGKGTIHARISGYYSSKIPGVTGNATVREWLGKKGFKEQFEFGIDTIKKAGGSKYLPPHLQ